MDKSNFYEREFKKATNEQQAGFLTQLFENDIDIQEQFQDYIKERERHEQLVEELKKTDVSIDKMQEEFRISLKEVQIDWEIFEYFNQEDNDYVPEYERAAQGAEEMLRQKYFEDYGKRAKIFLEQEDVFNAIKVLLAIYEGSINVYDLAYDELCVYEDSYNDTLKMLAEEQISSLIRSIEKVDKENEVVVQILDLFLSRVKFWKDRYDPKLNTDNWAENNVVYNLKKWEAFILMFLKNKGVAIFLEKKLLEYDLKNQETSKLFLKIAKLKGSEKDWVATAETFAQEDKKIMEQLLDFYFDKKMEKDFYRVAKKAFEYFPRHLGEQVLEKIKPEFNQDFYIEVLKFNTTQRSNIKLYQELRKFLDIEECDVFIQSRQKNVNFFVEILAVENNHEEILKIAQQHAATESTSSYEHGDFAKIIKPLLDVYPSECFELIKRKADKALENGRGRHIYEPVASWIALMKNIKGFENKFNTFLTVFMKKHIRLRNLKDEMQKKNIL